MDVKHRIRGFCQIAHARILPNPANWRTHPPDQRDALRGVLAEIGVVDAVLVIPTDTAALATLAKVARGDSAGFAKWLKAYKGTFLLADGHLRVEELAPHGDGTIDCLVLDLATAELAEVLATKDPISAMAGTDKGKLAALADTFTSSNAAVQRMVFALAGIESGRKAAVDATAKAIQHAAEAPAAAAQATAAAITSPDGESPPEAEDDGEGGGEEPAKSDAPPPDATGSKGLGQPVISYTIVFDDEPQQARFHELLRALKKAHPNEATAAARLDKHLTAHPVG